MGWLLAGREETQGGDDKMSKRIKKKHIKPISKKKKWRQYLFADGYRKKEGGESQILSIQIKSLGDSVYQVVEENIGISGRSARKSYRLNCHQPRDEDCSVKTGWLHQGGHYGRREFMEVQEILERRKNQKSY